MSPSDSPPLEKTLSKNGVAINEDDVLEGLGYQQELKRSFGLLGMIGFSFSIVTCWTALGGVLIVGIESGGPPVMVWSWLIVCGVTLAVAYSMAEICSAYPVAGGQYSWVAVLAPPRIARPMSWVTGWFMITGIVAMGATNNFITANFVLGMGNLVFPTYAIQRWQTVLLTYLITLIAGSFNIFAPRLLERLSKAILCWNILSFVVVIVTMLACNDHKQDASFVFVDFQNETGFNPAMGTIIGLLQSFFGMCCYDTPSHMTEEMKNPSKEAPKAIIWSVYMGAITGFIFLVSAFFCVGDLAATASTSTGVPLIEIFYNSTGSKAGACVLTSMITIIALVSSNSLMCEGSRALWAFSRDHGLPFSRVFARVEKKTQVPVNAVLLCMSVQAALNSIYFGNYTGFSTVISIATEGFYLSYAMPLLARLLSRRILPTLTGPYTLSPSLGTALNAIGLVFLLFAAITFNFPSVAPVDADNMNYCAAAIGVIGLVSGVTWVVDGRKNFTGPKEDVEVVKKEMGGGVGVGGFGVLEGKEKESEKTSGSDEGVGEKVDA